jgi:hypothetical protein
MFSISRVSKSHFRNKVSGSSKISALVFEPFQNHLVLPNRLGDGLCISPAVHFGACEDKSSRWRLDKEIVNEEDE